LSFTGTGESNVGVSDKKQDVIVEILFSMFIFDLENEGASLN
jgi:hypothetical protein